MKAVDYLSVVESCATYLRDYRTFNPITEDAMITLDVDGSSGDKTLELDIAQAMQEAFNIFKERQRKYGPGNIAAFGEVGCVVRATDKLARLRNLYVNGVGGSVADETAEDTWHDLANYALIGLLCHRGKWPGWTPTQRSLVGGPATAPLDPPPSGGC